VAVRSAEIVPAVAVKVPDVLPAATVMGVVTRRAGLFALRATAAPPDAAALVSLTVHVLLPAEMRLVGLHVSEATLIGATKETDADAEVAL
jgi:hypothetical protein